MRFMTHSNVLDRRTFMRMAGLGGAAVATSGLRTFAAARYDPSAAGLMEFDVSYRTDVHRLPSAAKDVHVWLPVPSADSAQEISNFEVDSPFPYEVTRDKTFGTKMLHVSPGAQLEPFTLEARYRVTRRRTGIQKATLAEAEAAKYLQLTRTVRMTPDIEVFADEILGDTTDPYQIGRRVFDGIQEILFYDNAIPGCGTGDTAWIMKHRRGKCDDYHALFMAIMVSRGVPIRWEQGFPLPFPDESRADTGQLAGDCSGSHCWTSFYSPDHGWVPVDVSEADKAEQNGDFFFGSLSPNRFQVSVGRSVVLNPAQGGAPLPSFAFAYAEADGIPLVYDANYVNTITYNVTHVEMS